MIRAIVAKIQSVIKRRDEAAPDFRGAERNRRALVTGSVATLARVIQIGSSLITVPLTLKYLGNERFGLWMTISSVMAMAAFADFGVGNGVLNTVAKAVGKDDIEGVRKAISSGFAVLNSIAVILLLVFLASFQFINWGNFFRVTSTQARTEAGPALAVFATCFALNISLDVVQRVQLGLQQGYRYSLWQLCGSTLGFIGVITGIWFKASLPLLVVAIAGAPLIATLLNAIHFFGLVRPDLRPSIRLVHWDAISQIAKLGGLFFVLQVVVAISYSADNFIIARTLGSINVPEYAIPQRIFAFISMMTGMLVTPLWPAYGEAISRGDIGWVRRTLRNSLLVVFFTACAASVLLLVLTPTILHLWVDSRIHPTFFLILGLAIWSIIDSCGTTLAMFLNGAAVVRFQIIVSISFGISCVCLKVFLVRRFGVVGVPWATIVSYTLIGVLPWIVLLPSVLQRLKAKPIGTATEVNN
jgi:O-antigen/teichoic acid export membrane protein